MPNRLASFLVVACALPVIAAPAAGQSASPTGPARATAATAAASLADVRFMAGHWRNDENGNLSEEIWTAPGGDSMQGMWRYVAAGKVRLFEALTLTEEQGTVVMRLRHFDPAMAAREEKPFALRLVSHTPGRAVFEGPGIDGLLRIIYERDGEGLTSIVERGGKREEFKFKRSDGK